MQTSSLLRVSRAIVPLLVAACGGGGERPPQTSTGGEAAAPPAAAAARSGAIDPALASQGESLFQTKGCIGCHTIGGGRLTGPDLQGVTERRELGWIMAMVTNPDSMLRVDATARQLFGEYMTPMMNMGVTPDEARALYQYLRRAAQP